MTLFETTITILAVLIVLLMCFIAYRVTTIWDANNFIHIEIKKVLNDIKDDILDDRQDVCALLRIISDTLDTMHRSICADVAEKMVDRAFPIKEGESLDKPFVSPGVTNWPPCYWGGPCTNPHHDCINCPRPNSSGGWTTTSNKVETTDNDK